jgi:hypothetical protein
MNKTTQQNAPMMEQTAAAAKWMEEQARWLC